MSHSFFNKRLVLVKPCISMQGFFFCKSTVLFYFLLANQVCIVNFKTASSLLRSPWLIDELWAATYYEELIASRSNNTRFKAVATDEENKEAQHPQQKFFANNAIKFAPDDAWTEYAKTFTGFDGANVAVIPLSGPLMKSDYCGYYGTQSMLSFFKLAEQTESIKEIILLIDSPGGTVDGTANFADAVKASNKPVTALINGLCASAAYWIGSSASTVIATSRTDIIGSIGTMIQMVDRTKYQESMGIVIRTYTAEDSYDKNKAFEDALKGDGKLLVKTMLNPLNDEFKGAIQSNREGKIKGNEVLTGKTFVAKEAVGNGLIDKIQNYDAAMQEIAKRNQSTSKKYIMAFEKLLTLTKAEAFKVVDGGFLLEESHLNAMEAHVATAEQTATKVTGLEKEVTDAKAAQKTAEDALAAANTKITSLETKVVELGKKDGATASTATAAGDKGYETTTATEEPWMTDFDRQLADMQARQKEL